MPIKLKPGEFPLIREYIEGLTGISVGDSKAYLIESRLSKLVAEYKCETFREFYTKLKVGASKELERKVINAMSTRETLWFRDTHPYKILKEVLLPHFEKELIERKRSSVRIWSSACSTGQEPYSIAMVILGYIATHPGIRASQFEIKATDIAPTAIETAQAGLYDKIAMGRGMPVTLRQKYFIEEGRYTRITDDVKKMVKFNEFNLQNPFLTTGQMDIVFCRNVAIYFSDDFKTNLYKKIHKTLRRSGVLFLGASESISAYSNDFTLKDYQGSIYYEGK
jgi:chemotaxis protein methyltransferase CheR